MQEKMIWAPAGPWKQIDQNEHLLRPIKKTNKDLKCPQKKSDWDSAAEKNHEQEN
jgi:hypothetical protein